jgi:hypothetical protein
LADYRTELKAWTNFGYLDVIFSPMIRISEVGRPTFKTWASKRELPKTNSLPILFGAFPHSELSDADIRDVQRQLAEHSFFSVTNTIVQVDGDGNIQGSNRVLYLPTTSVRVKGKELQVETGNLAYPEIRRRRMRLEKIAPRWELSRNRWFDAGPEGFQGRAASEKLTILVKGDLTTSEITNIVERAEQQIGRLPSFVYLDRRNDDLDLEPDVHLAEPRMRFVFFHADNRWTLNYIIGLTSLETPSLKGPVLPLLPKPDGLVVDNALAELGSVDTAISKTELRSLIETTLRIRRIDHRLVEVKQSTAGEITVMTGKISGPLAGHGDVVTFKRVGNKWIIFSVGIWDS